MKKYRITIIVSLLLWIPLAVIEYNHNESEPMIERIAIAVASGPIAFFLSGLISLLISGLMAVSFSIIRHLEAFSVDKEKTWNEMFETSFCGVYGIVFAILYYCTITNQHIFFRLYGGW